MESIPGRCMILPYQKIICITTNAPDTTPAQKMGRCHNGRWPSDGIWVQPYTRPASSASVFGLVIKLTTTVTVTQVMADQRARNMFSSMGLAAGDKAMY